MEKPHRASDGPYKVDIEAGKTYYWCSCGLSKRQPYCDGSHKETPFPPVEFTAEKTGSVYLCGCKQTRKAPFCDGSHSDG